MFTGGTIWILTHSHVRFGSATRPKKAPGHEGSGRREGEEAIEAQRQLLAGDRSPSLKRRPVPPGERAERPV